MIADLFEARRTRDRGRGIFATRFIPKGTVVYFYPCRRCGLYTKKDIGRMTKKEYDFMINHEVRLGPDTYSRFCDDRLAYINHSCNANMLESRYGFNIAVRDIRKGEEATEDYRQFRDEESVGFPGGCKCGEKDCMGKGTFRWPPSRRLKTSWDTEVKEALAAMPCVRQPLRRRLLNERPGLAELFRTRDISPARSRK